MAKNFASMIASRDKGVQETPKEKETAKKEEEYKRKTDATLCT